MKALLGRILCAVGLHKWSGMHQSYSDAGTVMVRLCGRCWLIDEKWSCE